MTRCQSISPTTVPFPVSWWPHLWFQEGKLRQEAIQCLLPRSATLLGAAEPRAAMEMGCPSQVGAVGQEREEQCWVSPSDSTDLPAASEPRSCWLSCPACPSSPLPQPKLRQTGRPGGEEHRGLARQKVGPQAPAPHGWDFCRHPVSRR